MEGVLPRKTGFNGSWSSVDAWRLFLLPVITRYTHADSISTNSNAYLPIVYRLSVHLRKRQRVTISKTPENHHHCFAQCLERFYQQDGVLQCKTSNDALIGHCWSTIRSETITRTSFVSHSAVLRFPDRVCALDRRTLLNDVRMPWIRRKYARSVLWIDIRRSTGTIGLLEEWITVRD
ncbi:hypothetical protein G5I_11860 [Acromyrmex echinatior]|uniref:Uncharacterized protein n=1 Tax=Acromyrmex echinatior TaxID=103372 RepID=F4X0G0_ACREC|nr:hypothetical protein G5I_11860 [Acromyrmex echinatior]